MQESYEAYARYRKNRTIAYICFAMLSIVCLAVSLILGGVIGLNIHNRHRQEVIVRESEIRAEVERVERDRDSLAREALQQSQSLSVDETLETHEQIMEKLNQSIQSAKTRIESANAELSRYQGYIEKINKEEEENNRTPVVKDSHDALMLEGRWKCITRESEGLTYEFRKGILTIEKGKKTTKGTYSITPNELRLETPGGEVIRSQYDIRDETIVLTGSNIRLSFVRLSR